jgi:hypothetical protein
VEAQILKDDLLNQVIEAESTGRPAAHHYDGISAQLQGLDEIPQDDFKGKTDAFVGILNA